MGGKKEHELAIQLYKTPAVRHGEMSYFENWDCQVACENEDKIYKELKQHNEAVAFWAEMRDRFADKLGQIHTRTLNS